MSNILNKINSPVDVKNLTVEEMKELASEIREVIIKKVNTTGGHMAPNLGIVEATMALHYVFNSPVDKFIFDVSHQCYTHKILTGRKDGFTDENKYYDYSGYTNPKESEHDIFKVGHTSTSVSLATGVAKARDLKGETGNVIALIGDGSLSGGEAFEGLNNAAILDSNIIILVNDNDMSIAENQGGLYKNLKELRDSKGKAECNFFKSMGFDYYYIEDGNNLEQLIETFNKVKDINHPTVVHITTLKGKGLTIAEQNKETFHWILPGTLDAKPSTEIVENYNTVTVDYVSKKAKEDKTLVLINPATPGACGFSPEFRKELGKQYVDVAISEEHAIAYSSALARCGAKPILAVLSSFIQRTYDQFSQDLCLNNNPATILVYWGGISNGDATHLGCFDIPMLSNIPNLVYLAPVNKEEYLAMLDWSVEQKDYSVAIRVPFGNFISTGIEDKTDYSEINKFKMEEEGKDVAIVALGSFFELGKKVKSMLKDKLNINATLINPHFITGIDKEMLEKLKSDHKLVITLEDGMLEGGFGEKITRFYSTSDMKVINYGANKEFTDCVPLDELYQRYHLREDLIVNDIKECLDLVSL